LDASVQMGWLVLSLPALLRSNRERDFHSANCSEPEDDS
jgi:hypothetical protein